MNVPTPPRFHHLAIGYFSCWRNSPAFRFQTFVFVSQVAQNSTYEISLSLSPLAGYPSMIKAVKNKTLPIMLGPLATRTRNRSWGDGGRTIRNLLSRHCLNGLTECK